MASSGEDLRRRPVHPEKVPLVDREVEISEVEEDAKQPHPLLEDDLDDDPLVLKGSRPTGPPKKLSEEEVSWGALGSRELLIDPHHLQGNLYIAKYTSHMSTNLLKVCPLFRDNDV